MASWRSMTKIAGSGSGFISQRHKSVDPDPDPWLGRWCPPTLSLVERNMPRGTPITPLIIVTNPKMSATLQNNNLLIIGVCVDQDYQFIFSIFAGSWSASQFPGPVDPDSRPYPARYWIDIKVCTIFANLNLISFNSLPLTYDTGTIFSLEKLKILLKSCCSPRM